MCVIYMIRNMLNGKIYIGKTSQSLSSRFENHANGCRGCGVAIHRAIVKYGKENFETRILCRVILTEDLNSAEKRFIKAYRSNDRRYGYNLTEGGDGLSNPPKSVRRKLSIATGRQMKGNIYRLGTSQTREARRKTSRSMKRYFRNHPEARKKMIGNRNALGNHAWLGRHRSRETCRKMGETRRRRFREDPEYCKRRI